MEGFVFDLQRFADNYWPDVLTSGNIGTNYYYQATQSGNEFSIPSNTAPVGNINTGTYYIRVEKTNDGAKIGITDGSASYQNNATMRLNFGDVSLGENAWITISGAHTAGILENLPSCGLIGDNVTLNSVQQNAVIKSRCTNLNIGAGATVHVTGDSLGTINLSAGAKFYCSNMGNIEGQGDGCTFRMQNGYGYYFCESGSFKFLSNCAFVPTGNITVGGNAQVECEYNRTITVNKYDDVTNNIVIVNKGNVITTVIANNGAPVKIYANGGSYLTYTSCADGSELTVSGDGLNNTPTITLTEGVFAATNDVYTLNNDIGVKYNGVVYKSQQNGSTSQLVNNVLNLTSGKFTSDGASTFTVGSATSTTYTTKGASAVIVNGNQAIFYGGGMTLSGGKSITVSNGDGTKKSTILAGEGSSIDVTVNNGATYEISGLDNGKTVSIDNVTYTYNNGTLLKDGVGWRLNGDSIGFTINNGTDTFITTYGEAIGPDMKTELNDIMGRMTSTGTLYFNATGLQQVSSDGAAYTLTKDNEGYYTLSSTDKTTTALTIDLTGVEGAKLNALTINLAEGAEGAQQVKLKAGASLRGLTLGAGDSVLDSRNNVLATGSTGGGTVKVEEGTVTALTGGSFVGVGEHNIDAATDVTIDGVTFAAGAKGTFTNGATAAADTFAVTAGTASIDNTFQGTTLTANGVTYTVVPGSTAATFSGTTNAVTGFTSGKITLTAADNTFYTIGGQTISDGNGAELTFVATNTNTYLCSTGTGKISLSAGEAITLSDENGTNPKTITAVTGSTIDVAVGTDGKYTLSGLGDGERVSIGSKTYLYRADTKFLEEYNSTYPDGSGDGYILTNDGSITLNSDGTPADNTAKAMPASLAEEGALDIISRAMPKGNTYYFNANGGRAENKESAAYTLEKKADGSCVLVSTGSCTGTLDIDARGLTGLTVDFSAGSGTQTLNVDEKTELASGSKFGANDVILYDSGTYVTCGTGTTSVFLTPGKPMTIEDMNSGTTVSVAPGKSVNVGNSIYTAAGTGLTLAEASDGTIGVQSGTLSATSGTYTMLDNGGNKGDVVTVSGTAEVSTGGTTGKATVKGLDSVGEKAVITDSSGKKTTYEVISPGIVKKVDSDGNTNYWRVTGEATFTDSDTPTGAEGPLDGAPVSTQGATEGTTYIGADGKPADEAGKAATLTNKGGSKELEVTQTLELGVQLTGDTVTVKDKGTDTTYAINDNTSVTAKGATFTTQDGVLSDVTGTIKVTSGTLDTKDGSDKAKYTLSGEGTKVNFQPGTSLSGTTVTTAGGNNIVIKENDNKNTTTVDSQGNVSGVDGNAEITGLPDEAQVSTTGSGTLSLNGKTWKVEGDTDGATFTVDADAPGRIGGVAGLDEGATLSTTENVSGLKLKGCTITSAKNGLSYTEGRTEGTGEFNLAHQGDSIQTAGGTTFTVDTNQNGVSIGTDGKLTGLTNGEKVTVTTADGTKLVYEVTGNTLVTTRTESNGTVTTMISILPEGETAFSIESGQLKAANGSTDASQIKENEDINAGSTEVSPVNTVTNGMLLDKKGHATAHSDKAIAEITIKNDGALKYEATKDVQQTIQVGAGSTAEWEIITSNKADTIDYAGKNDVSITARDGNDKITISGAGNAVVRGVSGKNTLIHTGTGYATLMGGSGNDTFKSTNENDTIIMGGGNNTLKMTAGVTNTISDYEYGKDKLQTATHTGALDLDGLNLGTGGTISYGTGEGATKVGNDGQEFYAATLTDADGNNKRNIGWTGENGGKIDATGQTEKVVLIGNPNGRKDTLMGGQAGDTIKAGNGMSSLWGAAGNDLIISSSKDSNEIFFLKGDGQDTVQGFTTYSESNAFTADTLDFYGQGVTSVKVTSEGLKLYNGEDSMLISGSFDENTMFQWKNDTSDKIRVVKAGRANTTNNMSYDYAVTDYVGSSKVDTITVADSGAVEIWMDGSKDKSYNSIEVVDASGNAYDVTIAGGEGNNTLVGSRGSSSLWGGAGNGRDVLIGNGQTDFFYGLGNGNDSIQGHAGDTVDLFDMKLSDITEAVIDTANKLVIFKTTANETVTVSGGVTDFKLDGQIWTTDYKSSSWTTK